MSDNLYIATFIMFIALLLSDNLGFCVVAPLSTVERILTHGEVFFLLASFIYISMMSD